MSKTFRPWKIDEPLLLPVTVADFVAESHIARFVLNVVRDEVDLCKITGSYGSEFGQPPFNPVMMTALLLYAYCSGIYSSRRIAKACGERVDFMSIVGLDVPDFRTISDFRKRHLKALSELFKQVLLLCGKAGLVKLGHVAFDGTKVKANASKHKAMSYGRMAERAMELEAEVAGWLSAAEAADAEEDKLYGRDKTGEELPDWVADKQRRADKIRQAKAELEAETKAAAEAERKERAAAEAKREAEGRRQGGRKAALPSPTPDAKAQIIVAQDVTQSASDCAQLLPMTDAIEANLGRTPEQASADAGYCSEENLAGLEARSIDGYVATGRARDAVAGTGKDEAARAPSSTQPAKTPTRVEGMRAKIKAGGHASPYRLRKQLPEPVFGQIKQARGFRQFLLRGFEKVRAEWALVCTAHNLLKLANGRSLSAALRLAVAAS